VAVRIAARQTALFTVVMALGALTWLVGQASWTAGVPLYRVVYWWAGFLVLTIAAERLELTRLLQLGAGPRRAFLVIVLVLLGALGLTALLPEVGVRVIGAAMLALAVWLGRFDIARRTVRQSGLTRFIAIALLAGYGWLGVAGALALHAGAVAAGGAYDAMLHAVFLGFVFSMIFGHAPVIFPAVLGVGVAYRPAFYAHLVLLHASVAVRIAGDLVPWLAGRRWGGLGNALAIGLFFASTLYSVLRPPPTR
jgi:hypothetical protein